MISSHWGLCCSFAQILFLFFIATTMQQPLWAPHSMSAYNICASARQYLHKTCVASKHSDYPVHLSNMARILVRLSLDSPEAVEGTYDQRYSDQMRSLVRVFAGRTILIEVKSCAWLIYCKFCFAPFQIFHYVMSNDLLDWCLFLKEIKWRYLLFSTNYSLHTIPCSYRFSSCHKVLLFPSIG